VAAHLGTVHHEVVYTVQEGLDAVPDVIRHLETYDVTTIRAATPMYLMARRIKAMGIKMVLSGEGADEIFGGYLYFHKAPGAEEFHLENCCASWRTCTCTTACAPTSRWPPGAWRRGCRSSTRTSWMWR
jgi:asparagine synthetase B (glutamine-hydrolysing)